MDIEEPHTPHKVHTGHRWVDVVLGLAAITVSAISLSVAMHHGHIMEKLVEANSFPNLEVEPVVDGASSETSFSLKVTNTGLGPARVETLELWKDDRPVVTSRDLLSAVMTPTATSQGIRLEGGSIVGRLVGAGRDFEFFKVTTDSAGASNTLNLISSLDSRICYCSVFEECFVADSRVDRGRPHHAERCPAIGTAYKDDMSAMFGPAA